MLKKGFYAKAIILVLLIPIGLYTKIYTGMGHQFVGNSLGGIIYVIFFIMLASLLFPSAPPIKLSFIVLCITCLLELSQLIQNDILNRLRTRFIFRALFGSVFNTSDFLFYVFGALLALGILLVLKKRT
jgi:hypothetical protein